MFSRHQTVRSASRAKPPYSRQRQSWRHMTAAYRLSPIHESHFQKNKSFQIILAASVRFRRAICVACAPNVVNAI